MLEFSARRAAEIAKLKEELESCREELSVSRSGYEDLVAKYRKKSTETELHICEDAEKIFLPLGLSLGHKNPERESGHRRIIQILEVMATEISSLKGTISRERAEHKELSDGYNEQAVRTFNENTSLKSEIHDIKNVEAAKVLDLHDNPARTTLILKIIEEIQGDDRQVGDSFADIISAIIAKFPDVEKLRPLVYISEERKRIDQYKAIIDQYSHAIAELRESDMDEDDREEAILAMKRLRDREIDALEQA